MYSMGLTRQPRNEQRWFMPRKKINTPGWTKTTCFSVKKRAEWGTTGVQECCLWPTWAQHKTSQYLTCLLTHVCSSQRSLPHGCSFPAQGCPHLPVQLSCGQASHITKGIQTDIRICRIAVKTCQVGSQYREKNGDKFWTEGRQLQSTT